MTLRKGQKLSNYIARKHKKQIDAIIDNVIFSDMNFLLVARIIENYLFQMSDDEFDKVMAMSDQEAVK